MPSKTYLGPNLDRHNDSTSTHAERHTRSAHRCLQAGRLHLTPGRNFTIGTLKIYTTTSLLQIFLLATFFSPEHLLLLFVHLLKCAFLQSSSELLLKLQTLPQAVLPQRTILTTTKNPPTIFTPRYISTLLAQSQFYI